MTTTQATASQENAAAELGPAENAATQRRPIPAHVAELIIDLQSVGLRVEAQLETRKGGAGPTDSGMLWIEGVAVTVPDRERAGPQLALCAQMGGPGIRDLP